MPTSLLLLGLLLGSGLIERVLAVVDGKPLLLSDTRAIARVRGVSEEAALELLVDEVLMYGQASRTPQAAVRPEEEEQARSALLERRPELGTDIPAKDLARLLRRQLAILKYVDFRFRPQVRPDEADLRRAYDEEYGGRPQAPPLETVVEQLRATVARRQLDEKVEAWVKELRGEAEVRLVRPATSKGAAGR
jgi:hypothetical protein